jgi:hypothetical protein
MVPAGLALQQLHQHRQQGKSLLLRLLQSLSPAVQPPHCLLCLQHCQRYLQQAPHAPAAAAAAELQHLGKLQLLPAQVQQLHCHPGPCCCW